MDRRVDRVRGQLPETADRCVAHHLTDLADQGELVGERSVRATRDHARERLLLPDGPDPAGHALPTGLVPEEGGDPEHDVGQVDVLVEHHHDAGAQRDARRLRVLEREPQVQVVRCDERACRTTQEDRLQRLAAPNPTGYLQQLAQGDAVLHLVRPRPFDAAGEAEQPWPGRIRRADPRVRLAAEREHLEHVHEGLDVVDPGGLAEYPTFDRERRLVPGLPALSLDRIEQRGLLTADVGAGAAAELDVEREPLPHHVGPEEPVRVGLLDRAFEHRGRVRVLAPDVDEPLLGTRGVPGDRQGFEHGERVVLHQHPVLERTGLGLVGVADEVVGSNGLLRDRLPLHPGGERRAATPEELGVLHLADHALLTELHRPTKRLVAAVGSVVVE